jgi:hypothetical protein
LRQRRNGFIFWRMGDGQGESTFIGTSGDFMRSVFSYVLVRWFVGMHSA